MNVTYRVELANKIRDGRAVGNLWGVSRFVDGCRNAWVMEPQESEDSARSFAESARAELRSSPTLFCIHHGTYACPFNHTGA